MKNSKRQKPPEGHWKHNISVTPLEIGKHIWLYGYHAVLAALTNPQRQKHRLVITPKSFSDTFYGIEPEIVEQSTLEQLLPKGVVHQGVALLTSPLPKTTIDSILENVSDESIVIVIDQAYDPRNIGAIIRSASAFKADAVIIPDRYSPQATSVLAKSASGALEKIPLIRVTNLARSLEQLKKVGYWCAGLVPDAKQTLAEAKLSGKIVLVFGAEGRGMRRLTRDKCDYLLRIPIDHEMGSLNIAAAAAISLYELNRIKNKWKTLPQ